MAPQTLHPGGKISSDEKASRSDAQSAPRDAASAENSRRTDKLLSQVYDELRRLAHLRMAELSAGQTLQPTALVHEAYLRLLDRNDGGWTDARHFFLAAARAMHDILVESARHKASIKRGGERRRLDLNTLEIAHDTPSQELLALEEAMLQLQRHDPRKHQIVLLRFFAGCTVEQAAEAMGLSITTIEREWRYARAWLHERLSEEDDSGDTDAIRA